MKRRSTERDRCTTELAAVAVAVAAAPATAADRFAVAAWVTLHRQQYRRGLIYDYGITLNGIILM